MILPARRRWDEPPAHGSNRNSRGTALPRRMSDYSNARKRRAVPWTPAPGLDSQECRGKVKDGSGYTSLIDFDSRFATIAPESPRNLWGVFQPALPPSSGETFRGCAFRGEGA